ncbi:hypothetical protein F183_A15650 [Bryobacterales bacterium F-183]|nr:hypothetical protein F183_A15650 [Bryobacterales bacterium F-183]
MYRAHSPETAVGKRGYTYEFVPAQGKLSEKQFQLVSITWSRRNPATSANSAPGTQGIGGPGGSFTDGTVQTADGSFDIRVTLGTLLPAEIQPPAFDPSAAAERIAAAYNARKIR